MTKAKRRKHKYRNWLRRRRREVADVVIYLDLLAHSLGFKLEDLVAEKFNIVSERKNVEIYL